MTGLSPPPRSSADIYARQSSRIPYPPFLSPNVAPAMASPVSVSSRNSALVHRGFYDLLSLVPSTPGVGVGNRNGGSRFWGGQAAEERDFIAGPRYEDYPQTPASPVSPVSPTRSKAPPAPTRSYGLDWAYNYYSGSPPASPPISPPRAAPRYDEPPVSPRGKRRVSKDMVSKPTGFV